MNNSTSLSMAPLGEAEINLVGGGGACGQDVAGAGAAIAGIVGVIASPITFGASLAAVALFGLAAGIYAGEASQTCK